MRAGEAPRAIPPDLAPSPWRLGRGRMGGCSRRFSDRQQLGVLTLILSSALASTGCRLPGRDGPVPASVVACRELSQRGISAMERRDWTNAELLLAKAVESCPEDVEARRHHAEALWFRGQHQQAVGQLAEAIRLSGDDPTLWVRWGEMQLALGQLDPGLQGAQTALDLDPGIARGWALRGKAMRQRGDSRAALADFQHALALDPNNRDLLFDIAEMYRELQQPRRALASLQTLLESYPAQEEPQKILLLAGLAYMALDRPEEAVERLLAADRRGPPSTEVLYQLALAELQAGRPDLADAAARNALTLDPRHPASRELLERMSLAQRDPAIATNR